MHSIATIVIASLAIVSEPIFSHRTHLEANFVHIDDLQTSPTTLSVAFTGRWISNEDTFNRSIHNGFSISVKSKEKLEDIRKLKAEILNHPKSRFSIMIDTDGWNMSGGILLLQENANVTINHTEETEQDAAANP
jgi:hypothetical protein